MKINSARAEAVLREQAGLAETGPVDPDWLREIEELSRLCEEADIRTHIAFFGVATLAKSVDIRADLYAIKPKHAGDNPNAFSARILIYDVLAPLAAELGFSLGVTGREPLNNQPYFRMKRLDDGTPMKESSRKPFEHMLGLIRALSALESEAEACEALRAFVAVRRRYQPVYADALGDVAISPEVLKQAVKALVAENSEGGRRAQAVAAGLFDVFAGPERVESGRINDPSRKYPGDVCIRSAVGSDTWEKAVEVRDKPVRAADVRIFGAKCVAMGVHEAAVLMAAADQPRLAVEELTAWAAERGLSLTLFQGWDDLIDQILFWSALPKSSAASVVVDHVQARLVTVEAPPAAIESWQRLVLG
ncbi:SacI restriction endonuclease [Novosphingobium resinovorum]|uniref:SacI restriction endonuclease n=1 Tax=Novosphingobium resinovorum TaxID=158500 RepID=A0A031J419_9SPHN|nr:restriction endonuclease, SacI family [Novosphingobium resinovorum]EZP68027.1 SacI restriction endonuclease [Novosphingobium resinovorum]